MDQMVLPSCTKRAAQKCINDMPSEVLLYVFRIGKEMDCRFTLLVSWVSRYWRTLSLTTPSLWDTVAMLNGNMAIEYLTRNPGGLINLLAECSNANLASATSCLELMQPHRARFRDVSLTFFDVEACENREMRKYREIIRFFNTSFWFTIEDIPSCQLRSFSMQCRTSEAFPEWQRFEPIIIPAASTLHTVNLREMLIQLIGDLKPAYAHAYHAIQSFSAVRSALWATGHGFGDPMCWFFQRTPQIKRVFLVSVDVYPDDNWIIGSQEDIDNVPVPQNTITLRNLRSLRVLRTPKASRFLLCLQAPQLRHFEWEEEVSTSSTSSTLWQHCASQFQALTSLHLMGFPSEGSNERAVASLNTLSQWLKSLHHLQSLILIFDRSCVYNHHNRVGSEHGVVTILRRLAETCNNVPSHCEQLNDLHIGPVLPGELAQVQPLVQVRSPLRVGKLRIVQYTDTQRSTGDASWFESNVAYFRLIRMIGHGRGCRYGHRIRYVKGTLLKTYSSVPFDPTYFNQVEAE